MGIARILGGGPDGRYTVRVDYGDAAKQGNLARLDQQDAEWFIKQVEANKKYTEANDEYQAYRTGYVNALNVAIDMLNFALLQPGLPEIQAKAAATKAAAQTKFNEASTLHATRAAELQTAQAALAGINNSLATAQTELVQAQQARSEGAAELQAAENYLAAMTAQVQVNQQQTAAAEAAYAAAVETGVGVEDARIVMQARQQQLSASLAAQEQAREAVVDRRQALAPLEEAAADAQQAVDTLVAQKSSAQNTLDLAIIAEQSALANKQVATAELERATADAAAILAQPNSDAAVASAKQSVLAAQAQLAQLDMANAPKVLELKRTLDAIKLARAQLADMRQRWVDAEMVETKAVWCVDLTETGTGDVATIDINGESQLQLLAPGCRPWQAGDGTISTESKAEGAARLEARRANFERKVTALTAQIDDAVAKEQQLKAAMDQLQAQYNAADSVSRPALGLRVSAAALEYQDQQAVVRNLKMRKVDAQARVGEAAQALLKWQSRPASDEPNAGDGAFLHPVAQAPWQSFVNLAIHPGWQRHMPTYRWGTALEVDENRNTMDVQLAPATSSVQSLDINQQTVLRQVPVQYMTCNASVFEKGDRVVVRFKGQSWSKPQVIGFLDEPKSCTKYRGTFNLPADDVIQRKHKNRFWDEVEAPATAKDSVYPFFFGPFYRWTDGIGTRKRPKQKVTGDFTVTAQYYRFPEFRQVLVNFSYVLLQSQHFFFEDRPWDSYWAVTVQRTVVVGSGAPSAGPPAPFELRGFPNLTVTEVRSKNIKLSLPPVEGDSNGLFPDLWELSANFPELTVTQYGYDVNDIATCRYGYIGSNTYRALEVSAPNT